MQLHAFHSLEIENSNFRIPNNKLLILELKPTGISCCCLPTDACSYTSKANSCSVDYINNNNYLLNSIYSKTNAFDKPKPI